MYRLFLVFVIIVLIHSHGSAAEGVRKDKTRPGPVYSKLWGKEGELWTPQSRLPDFSYAGYHFGEDPIPNIPVTLNVKDFGAKGDGKTDDTAAFLKAIAELKNGALFIPEGRYVITYPLELTRSNTVLRGAGRGKTVLYFPKPLTKVGQGKNRKKWRYISAKVAKYPKHWQWPWLRIKNAKKITDIIEPAFRGATELKVSSGSKIKEGQLVELVLINPADMSLTRYVHGGIHKGAYGSRFSQDHRGKSIHFVSRIKAVKGNTVVLERPIRTPVRLEWRPRICIYKPILEEIGFEDFTMEMKAVPYTGHHHEIGYGGIGLFGVDHGWVRRIEVLNADTGCIGLSGSRFCTVQKIRLGHTKDKLLTDRFGRRVGKGTICGHGGMGAVYDTMDCLFTEFEIDTGFIHVISIIGLASGNVFSNGKGRDICFDHHRYAPYENLFTNIDMGKGTNPWASSGFGNYPMCHSGVRSTFWNIRGAKPCPVPSLDFGPQLNFISVDMAPVPKTEQPPTNPKNRNNSVACWAKHFLNIEQDDPAKTDEGHIKDFSSPTVHKKHVGNAKDYTPPNPARAEVRHWLERIDPDRLYPRNLHEAQVERRLGMTGTRIQGSGDSKK
jgi:hypothetical protein